MGQLIKLQDYVSRYEQNIYHYPSRFVRLKKQQWEKLLSHWESGIVVPRKDEWQSNVDLLYREIENDQTVMKKMKDLFRFNKQKEDESQVHETEEKLPSDEDEEDPSMQFSPQFALFPETEEELKHQFLDQLFRFQMRWATSTLTEKSVVRKQFYFDPQLKFFLQRFPDNCLVLYKPIFLLKKAPVETEVILISPTEVQCISFIEKEENAVFIGSSDHFWKKRYANNEEKVLNPLLSVNRMGNIVGELFRHYGIDLPVKKVILSRNGYIDYPSPPYDVHFVEKRNFNEWFQRLRTLPSPLKHMQLKGANTLLQHCQTTSYKRLEWEELGEKSL